MKGLGLRIAETEAEEARVEGLVNATAIDTVDATTLKVGGTAVTSTAAELNILDGVTATAAELNILDGVTATAAELNYLDIATLGTGAASKAVVLDSGDDYTWPATGVLTYGVLNDGTTQLNATAAEINEACDKSANAVVALTSDTALTQAAHAGRIVTVGSADGDTITLPAATGTGDVYTIVVAVTVTSNNHIIQVANATDEFVGVVYQVDTDTSDTLAAYPALDGDGFDTITMDGSTKGGLQGDKYVITDVAAGKFQLEGHQNATGTAASPLSAAVS